MDAGGRQEQLPRVCRTMIGLTAHPSANSGRTVKPCTLSRFKLVANVYIETNLP